MILLHSAICTRCAGFFCLAIIKGPPNDVCFIIEEPFKHYFTEKSFILSRCILSTSRNLRIIDFLFQ